MREKHQRVEQCIELSHAVLKGVGRGIESVIDTVIHPIDNLIYPISLLAWDAAIITCGQDTQAFKESFPRAVRH